MIGIACLDLPVGAGQPTPLRKTTSILLVEDHPVAAEALTGVLVRAGHEVIVAGDGADAVRWLDRRNFDVVVTDIVMPRMDGLELIRHLRRKLPALPVVAISGDSSIEPSVYLRIASHFGVQATIAKPFGASILVETLRALLRDVTET